MASPGPAAVPSVADLATMRTWTVTTSGPKGHWHTAERTIHADGRQWTIGLTPAIGDAIALILWSDHVVRAHRRGSEPDMVRTALLWATNLLNGRPWTAPPPPV
jgi:hypothetical protein